MVGERASCGQCSPDSSWLPSGRMTADQASTGALPSAARSSVDCACSRKGAGTSSCRRQGRPGNRNPPPRTRTDVR
eukprot:14293705-Alexandrium_andersonii.AAC.1